MRIKPSKSGNSISYSIIKDIYSDDGKRTTMVVKSLGNAEQILKDHPGVDPEEWAREQARILTEQEKAGEITVEETFNENKLIDKGLKSLFNVGYLYLRSIFSALKLPEICQRIKDGEGSLGRMKFKFDLSAILSCLIYLRILDPGSKKYSFEHKDRLLGFKSDFAIHDVYRALEVLAGESDFIQSELYRASSSVVDRNDKVLFYDCTNYYFEIEEAHDDLQYGISKEHRPNPIVQMGLFMDGSGFPLAFSLFPGNQNEQVSLKPLERKILEDFDLSEFVVCTDAGLSSNANRRFNSVAGRQFVTTQSIKKLRKHLKDWALDPNGWNRVGSRKLFNLDGVDLDVDDSLYYKERWINEDGFEQRLFVSFSPKHARYQSSIRNRQINRSLNKLNNPSRVERKGPNDPNRFIKSASVTEDGEIAKKMIYSLDEERIAEEARFDGFYGICTSLESSPLELIKINKNRWMIEETFRIMKTNLEARPVYLQRKDRIEAHFLTCFLALMVYRVLEERLSKVVGKSKRFTCEEIIESLRDMSVFKVNSDAYLPAFERNDLSDAMYEAFGFRFDTQINTQKKIRNILKQTEKGK